MKQQKVIIILVLLTLIKVEVNTCSLTQIGTVTCDINCDYCRNGTCLSCCSGYYRLSNWCYACDDSNCLFCSSSTCYTCINGYDKMVSYNNRCGVCDSLTSVNCDAVNSCSSNSSCVNCISYAINEGNQCVLCSGLFLNCEFCNNFRCLSCYSGYYFNISADYKQCVICSVPKCTSCSHSAYCQTCKTGYYNTNGSCQLCRSPCLSCSSLTYCNTCVSTSYVLISGRCLLCTSQIAGCSNCAYSSSFGTTACLSCVNNSYYLSSPVCLSCASPCLTCVTLSNCLSCVNSTYAYNSAGYSCLPCQMYFPNCTSCTISSCSSCATTYYLSGGSCTSCNASFTGCNTCNNIKCFDCLPGYLMLSNLTCIFNLCHAPCSLCGASQTTCISCINGYYLSGSSCLLCDSNCKICASLTYCYSCLQQMENANGICIACTFGKYYNRFSFKCQNCPSNCLSCSIDDGCYNCTSSLFIVGQMNGRNVCTDICGDTFASDLQCDAVIGIANDGCTDSCTIQPNYNCTKLLGTAIINGVSASVNTSQCSYIGNISVSIVSAVQSLFSNSLKLGFSIQPYLLGMPTNADTQTYLKSIFTLSPFDTLTDYQIAVDEKLETVYFKIAHSSDISALSPNLSVNFNYLASVNTMFQYMPNSSYALPQISQILSYGRLGKYQQESNLLLAKSVYNWSVGLALCSIFIMVFGIFGKQLVGLDQAILCQHVFFLIVFYKGKLTLPLLALSGLRYSTGIHLEDSLIAINQGQSYILQFDSSSFLYNFNLNLATYALPLIISFFILLYKLRYKHLPALRDSAQQTYEVIMGQTILYLVMFNLSGLIAYSYLYYTSSKSMEYYENFSVSIAAIMTLFALFNFFVKPEIVGMFRSAFKTESDQRESRKSHMMEKFSSCISKRCCEINLKAVYAKTASFYSFYICYLLIFVFLAVLSPFQYVTTILIIQILIFAAIIFVRPHFNPFEKLRALLTWFLIVLGTLTVAVKPNGFILPILFLILLTIHLVASILIIIHSIWQQIKRKCNDRSQAVKKLMKEGETENQRNIINQLIIRYQNLERKNSSIGQQVEKIQFNFKENFNQQYQELQINTPKQQLDEDKVQFQQQIIKEQHQHFRYQKGLQFFNKYTNTIDLDLIKEYSKIDNQ